MKRELRIDIVHEAGRRKLDIYAGRDPRDLAAYSVREVATSIRMAPSTVRAWSFGQSNFAPVLDVPRDAVAEGHALSFFNLIEAHVIAQLRRAHGVPMPRVRQSLAYLRKLVPVAHPLVERELYVTPDRHLYTIHGGRKIDVSFGGQYALADVIRDLLTRVDKGPHGIVRFFPPMTPPQGVAAAEYRPIVVDPEVCFGRPLINGTPIPTDVLAERYLGGDSAARIAEDYDRPEEEIREALRFEGVLRADAA